MLRNLKEGALELALKKYLKERFGEYGEILDCEIDTKANRLRLDVCLHGETTALHAAIEFYELQQLGEDSFVVLRQFSSSRQWLTTLLNQLLKDKRYKIPAALAHLL